MAWTRNNRGQFTARQRKSIVYRYVAGRPAKDIAEEAGCTVRTIYTLLTAHEARTGEKIIRHRKGNVAQGAQASTALHGQNTVEAAQDRVEICADGKESPTAESHQLERENDYLRWVAKGAINGWVDRLIQDIKEGSLT